MVVPVDPAVPSPRTERRLAAILAADIVGYSRLVEQDEAGTLAAIRELRASAIDPLLAEHKGRIVKLMGDGALVEFASVVDAVACAVAIQHAVADRQAETPPERRLVFRIGINLGDVVVDGEDLLGDGVNVGARLEQLCEPGGVLVSGTAYDHLQGRLGLPLEFTGEQQVKNIARPVRAYRVRLDGAAAGWRTSRAPSRRSQRSLLTAAAALFAAVFLGGIWWLWPSEPRERPAIAVLPFDNLGGDEASGRLADGITEDIITDLARFRDLDVIARNSTELYKGKPVDVRQVGRELGVGYVLEGSIQREAGQVRIAAQLIETDTGGHIWSDRWDRPATDVFAVQADLSENVVNRVAGFGAIDRAKRFEARRKRPEDLDAYETYLLGTEALSLFTAEGAALALRLLEDAVSRDPRLARAWTAMTWANFQSARGADDPRPFLKDALAAGERAVEADPSDAYAHAALGEALGANGEMQQAELEYDKALELNPGSADILTFYSGWAMSFGKPEAGAEAADRARRLNPNYPRWAAAGYFAHAYFSVGRYEDTLEVLNRLPAESRGSSDLVLEAGSLAMLGRGREAAAVVKRALAADPDLSIETTISDPGYSEPERARFIETMRKAGFPA